MHLIFVHNIAYLFLFVNHGPVVGRPVPVVILVPGPDRYGGSPRLLVVVELLDVPAVAKLEPVRQ